MKKFFISLILLGSSSLALAQNTSNGGNLNTNDGRVFLSQTKLIKSSEVRDGSAYYNGDTFKKVSITGYSANLQDLRYNAYSDEMEYQQGNDIYSINKIDGMIIKFDNEKKIYECLNYNLDGKDKLGYLVQLVNNPSKYSLYKRERVELLKGEKSPNGITKDRNDYYAKDKEVYIIRGNGTFMKVPKNKKDFLNDFKNKTVEIEGYLKQNQINFKSESDLIKLVTYINTL